MIPELLLLFIRVLFLEPKTYEGLLHFFNSDAYDLNEILRKWVHIIESSSQSCVIEGRGVLFGDHTKLSKEGRRMPGMKSHHQESENFGKPSTIFGFHFGMLGIPAGNRKQKFCIPAQLKIHERTKQLSVWEDKQPKGRALRLIDEAISLVKASKRSYYLLLDRDFMSKEALSAALNYNSDSHNRLDLIVRCKRNVTCRRRLTEEERLLTENRKSVAVRANTPILLSLFPGLKLIKMISGKLFSTMAPKLKSTARLITGTVSFCCLS